MWDSPSKSFLKDKSKYYFRESIIKTFLKTVSRNEPKGLKEDTRIRVWIDTY